MGAGLAVFKLRKVPKERPTPNLTACTGASDRRGIMSTGRRSGFIFLKFTPLPPPRGFKQTAGAELAPTIRLGAALARCVRILLRPEQCTAEPANLEELQ